MRPIGFQLFDKQLAEPLLLVCVDSDFGFIEVREIFRVGVNLNGAPTHATY